MICTVGSTSTKSGMQAGNPSQIDFFAYRIDVIDVISNPVTGIILDGSLSDSAGVTAFDPDADDVSGAANLLDWRQVYVAHDASNLYVAYENDGAITLSWASSVYIDADSNRGTDFRAFFSIGADYLLQGFYLWEYTGDGTSWEWRQVGIMDFATSGNTAEFAVPLTSIGSPSGFDFFLLGENLANPGGSALDEYPDGTLRADGLGSFFSYRIQP